METLTPSSDTKKAADLLQNLSLDSEPKTTVVPEPAKSGHALAKVSKPFNLNASFTPNGHPSTAYYYGGYDGQGDWNSYSRYMNLNGGMTQGVWGDGSSYLYHQGYGYTPYGAPMQHDDKFYGLQQYHYPSYYQSPTSADGSFAANKINAQPGKISTAISDEHTLSSGVINNESSVGVVNEDSTHNNGLKDFLSSSKPSLLNSNDSTYQRAGFPVYAPLPGHQDPRVVLHGTQPALPAEALIFSDKKSYDGAKIGLSSPAVPAKKTSSQRNSAIPQPLPQSMNYGSLHSSGLEPFYGFINGIYPSNTMYNQYGNTYRPNSHIGPSPYGFRMGSVDNKLKVANGRVNDHFKRNMDGFGELSKGPRSGNGSDDKSMKGPGPVTPLTEGQNLRIKSDNKKLLLIPNKKQYDGEDFSENYSDAKFFVIKSYSEDDIHKSIKYNVWSSTLNGNKKLDAAYHEAKEKPGDCPVFLLFSVNTSGQFVGLAEMVSPVDFGRTVEYWQQDRWTGCFSVKWHIIKDIPNSVLRQITLENNENKPVTNSRDTQEVKFQKGIQVLKIFKEQSSKTCILDDFGFYETREKMIQERKSKEQQLPKQVSKSHDEALTNESATTGEAGQKENLVEENGSTAQTIEDCSNKC
ncbi:YTH domain-containing protein ECT2-like isoform X1 [Vigna umbellata]|uniref:YTH domain-containing protein ECT2-like isoform X1 n=2 Tax=Vigna umbellata TaxID=87088 RepID=UPI001F5FBF6B|nr:YTH domain-containing protein ECT2-like isoform X1 [Vigna umbellata]